MYVLDTDHLSILERGGKAAQPLWERLAQVQADQVAVTIITYEEQTRGWLSYLATRSLKAQVQAYDQLKRHLETYRIIPILDFDERSASEFQRLRKQYPRLGAMDLKIAAITLVNDAVLLTRNIADFEQLGLRIEDWTL